MRKYGSKKLKIPFCFNIIVVFVYLTIITTQFACRKFVQVDPPATGIASASVYTDNASAAAVLTGIYSKLIESPQGMASGNYSIGYLCGLSSDELTNYSTDDNKIEFYTNALTASRFNYFWGDIYQQVYVANAAIQGINGSSKISSGIKNQLLGEAKFIRAFLYFYGVNLFGEIPLLLTTDYRLNNTAQRNATGLVYDQIVSDLIEAKSYLSDSYKTPANQNTDERVRPNKGAASALLARVYLFQQKWKDAEQEADGVINRLDTYELSGSLDDVFLRKSREVIWQLQSVYPGANTFDAYYYVLLSDPGTGQYEVSLSKNLIDNFENGDKRFNSWTATYTPDSINYFYYPFKYKVNAIDVNNPLTECTVVLRLAEQYLIRAEARAQQGNIQGALDDLNLIRSRAGLMDSEATTKDDVLRAIYHERQVELFTEWGHRWLDLKRTGLIDNVMSIVTAEKGGNWNKNKKLFPIPLIELQRNSFLTQNAGY